MAAADPGRPCCRGGVVRLGRDRADDRVRRDHPLPGIWDSLHVDTVVTLPVGVEAYAAFALRAWLASSPVISDRTRRFARWSAIGSLLLGMVGQVAYHLLTEAHITRAPQRCTPSPEPCSVPRRAMTGVIPATRTCLRYLSWS